MTDGSDGHRVLVVGHAGMLGMELLAVRDMFEIASQLQVQAGHPVAYRVEVASLDGAPLELGGGLSLDGAVPLRGDSERIGTLAVVGGFAAPDVAEADDELVAAIRSAADRAERVVSICTGAFFLAGAGLLDGRRATTHWGVADRLANAYPAVTVEPDAIYLRDGRIWTSAGVTAAHDLVLALVEHDLGAQRALELARMVVIYLRRPGGQSQFSVHLAAPAARRQPIREAQQYMLDNPGADLSLAALAARVNLSPRHFARLFSAEVGMSPGHYVERVRLEAARRSVESTDHPLAAIAAATGFGTAENLRRVFVAALGVGPAEYRRRFNPYQQPGLDEHHEPAHA
ncbi:MAG TPA: helix-turn-helix domain-containing protein [Pseudonocardia sp.]|jgi:transcriptional regulator GlxA family with amidase domain|nr:helix-turn-helix domain-containing protein [Pseudonocardia sp.]